VGRTWLARLLAVEILASGAPRGPCRPGGRARARGVALRGSSRRGRDLHPDTGHAAPATRAWPTP